LECWNPKCLTSTTLTDMNYCPDCGVRLMQNCAYCMSPMSCGTEKCPNCYKMLTTCHNCNISYALECESCEECKQSLLVTGDVFLPYVTNYQNENSIVVADDKRIDIWDQSLSLAGGVCRGVARDTTILYWKKVSNGNYMLHGEDITNGVPLWKSNYTTSSHLKLKAIRNMTIHGAYILTHFDDCVLINALSDGCLIAKIHTEGPCKTFMLERKLVVIRSTQNEQRVEVYEYPFNEANVAFKYNLPDFRTNKKTIQVIPAYNDDSIYFVDYNADIVCLSLTNKSTDINVLYENHDEEQSIKFMAFHDGKIIFSLARHSDVSKTTIQAVDVVSKSIQPITPRPVSLATMIFAVHDGSLFVCENKEKEICFIEYSLASTGTTINQKVVRGIANVREFYLAINNQDRYILYLSAIQGKNMIEARRMHFDNGEHHRIKQYFANEHPFMLNVYDYTIGISMSSGQCTVCRLGETV